MHVNFPFATAIFPFLILLQICSLIVLQHLEVLKYYSITFRLGVLPLVFIILVKSLFPSIVVLASLGFPYFVITSMVFCIWHVSVSNVYIHSMEFKFCYLSEIIVKKMCYLSHYFSSFFATNAVAIPCSWWVCWLGTMNYLPILVQYFIYIPLEKGGVEMKHWAKMGWNYCPGMVYMWFFIYLLIILSKK